MQLTGGQFKGMKAASPEGARSTLSVVRESVFNILATRFGRVSRCDGGGGGDPSIEGQPSPTKAKHYAGTGDDFSGLRFLDGFSGSGIMALEAASRGFEAVAIEKNPAVARVTRENIREFGLKLIVCDFLKFRNEKFDVIYLDPPWDLDYGAIIASAAEKLTPEGVIICEHDRDLPPHNLKIIKEKKYGRTRLTVLGATFQLEVF